MKEVKSLSSIGEKTRSEHLTTGSKSKRGIFATELSHGSTSAPYKTNESSGNKTQVNVMQKL